MKEIVLPSSHQLFDYFPKLKKRKQSRDVFLDKFNKKLQKIFDKTAGFDLQRNIDSHEEINNRYPMMTPYFIRDIIKNKKMIHVGSRGGELDEGFSYYVKELQSIERDDKFNSQIRQRIEKNQYPDSKWDFKEYDAFEWFNDDIHYDVYYFWLGYQLEPGGSFQDSSHPEPNRYTNIDIKFFNYLYNRGHTGTFLLGVPQTNDKFEDFMESLLDVTKNKNVKIDYIPILFDESENWQLNYSDDISAPQQFDVIHHNGEWNEIFAEYFSPGEQQKGIMLMIKIDIGDNND